MGLLFGWFVVDLPNLRIYSSRLEFLICCRLYVCSMRTKRTTALNFRKEKQKGKTKLNKYSSIYFDMNMVILQNYTIHIRICVLFGHVNQGKWQKVESNHSSQWRQQQQRKKNTKRNQRTNQVIKFNILITSSFFYTFMRVMHTSSILIAIAVASFSFQRTFLYVQTNSECFHSIAD